MRQQEQLARLSDSSINHGSYHNPRGPSSTRRRRCVHSACKLDQLLLNGRRVSKSDCLLEVNKVLAAGRDNWAALETFASRTQGRIHSKWAEEHLLHCKRFHCLTDPKWLFDILPPPPTLPPPAFQWRLTDYIYTLWTLILTHGNISDIKLLLFFLNTKSIGHAFLNTNDSVITAQYWNMPLRCGTGNAEIHSPLCWGLRAMKDSLRESFILGVGQNIDLRASPTDMNSALLDLLLF